MSTTSVSLQVQRRNLALPILVGGGVAGLLDVGHIGAFVGGFVFNLGELAYRKEDKIAILPLCTLWALPAGSGDGT